MASFPVAVHELHAPVDKLLVDCRREDVCRALLPRPLQELKVARPGPLRGQKLPDGKMPRATDT
eukprot:9026082-Alexandrium_andersonii.AAC.1